MDNSECFGVKVVKIYPVMTSQYFFGKNMVLVDYIGIFLHAPILLATYCISTCILVAVETTM
jgi:hypothetical protein